MSDVIDGLKNHNISTAPQISSRADRALDKYTKNTRKMLQVAVRNETQALIFG